MKINKRIFKKNLAFTLVELLIVISIMGILTVMVSSSFKTVQAKARDAKRKSGLDSLAKALNIYFTDNGEFLDYIDFINGDEIVGEDGTIYMKEIPVETISGIENYVYQTTDTKKSFRLFAELENGEDNSCLYSGICPFTVSDGNCCYGISSSNIGVSGDML